MKHYIKMIWPEHGHLDPEATNSWCRNVQIIPERRKYGAGTERVRCRYRQIDNMKHICQLHASNCQISNSSQIVIN